MASRSDFIFRVGEGRLEKQTPRIYPESESQFCVWGGGFLSSRDGVSQRVFYLVFQHFIFKKIFSGSFSHEPSPSPSIYTTHSFSSFLGFSLTTSFVQNPEFPTHVFSNELISEWKSSPPMLGPKKRKSPHIYAKKPNNVCELKKGGGVLGFLGSEGGGRGGKRGVFSFRGGEN